jgi:hypothetical protein
MLDERGHHRLKSGQGLGVALDHGRSDLVRSPRGVK